MIYLNLLNISYKKKMKKQENLEEETELNEQENLKDSAQETNSKKKVHLKGEKEEIIKKGEKTLSEFKKFIAKGNVMDLAVGVIIGSAFGKIVSSIVDDILMPLIGVIIGGIDFSNLSIKIGEATVTYGNFIQNVIDFLIIAACRTYKITKYSIIRRNQRFIKRKTRNKIVIQTQSKLYRRKSNYARTAQNLYNLL